MALVVYGANTTPFTHLQSFTWPLSLHKYQKDELMLNAESQPWRNVGIWLIHFIFSAGNTLLATGCINIYNLALH